MSAITPRGAAATTLQQQAAVLTKSLAHYRGMVAFCHNHRSWRLKHRGLCLNDAKAVRWEAARLATVELQLTARRVRQRVVQTAARLIGVPYRYGGSSQWSGFDCSGLVQYVFSRLGIYVPRTTFAQYRWGEAVSRSNLKPGDAVYAYPTWYGPDHAMIYIGGGVVIAAPHTGSRVEREPLSWFSNVYVGARCFLGARLCSA